MRAIFKITTILSVLLTTGCAAPLFEVVTQEKQEYSAFVKCTGFLPNIKEQKHFNSINVSKQGVVYLKDEGLRDGGYRYSTFGLEDMYDVLCENESDYSTIDYVVEHNIKLLKSSPLFIEL